MVGIGRKNSLIKFHFPFLPKVGEFGRKEKIYTKHEKLRFFSFLFFSLLFPSFLFSSLLFLSFTKNEPNTLLVVKSHFCTNDKIIRKKMVGSKPIVRAYRTRDNSNSIIR